MLTDAQVVDVIDNADQNRFELRLSGDLVGILGYFDLAETPPGAGAAAARPPGSKGKGRQAPVVSFMHTVIVEDFGHRGLAALMVGRSLDLARGYGWKIRPVCTYVQRFVSAHPEYRDLIVPVER
ncbi:MULTISPECIES: GNAT family N-acetyltransferase [unclassified Rhodococcus (in: high G+C Gram-positive bacteria)]|uniref:GNAT family N-acetyltransferase n=1 Tax=unclassified Rhodococcus (in: high G+C Gram-positive bacteria) TaxID=192944 RepID=UPI001639E86B|nr:MULTISPECIES: GNAT family N-acetyltransferase [unclassified Rhodococcus (in: high G+C Gram-positive bacteria)]MBC2639575.1 N-acetyltransferase [Rhodococcus sp. 3A]MBC2895680.1 N-acetyltransferase [Rhodococcus sp. 4CII]